MEFIFKMGPNEVFKLVFFLSDIQLFKAPYLQKEIISISLKQTILLNH